MGEEVGERSYDSLEEAARGDIPERYARVLAVTYSSDGTKAVVLLGTNEEPTLYPYEVVCQSRNGRWFEGSGSNLCDGVGWTTTSEHDAEENVGVLMLIGLAPGGVTEVVIEHRGREDHVEVSEDGYFIHAVWDVPAEAMAECPTPVRFVRPDGSEFGVPDTHPLSRIVESLDDDSPT